MKTFIRKILLSVVLCFVMMGARGQFVTIPDTNFVNWLNGNGFAGCMNGSQMDTTCTTIINATSINCSNANITDVTGISYFDSLKTLVCENNFITSLPVLPSSLLTLNCYLNQLVSIASLPTSLRSLSVRANQLTSIPPLPPQLIDFDCAGNYIPVIPSLPITLKTFYCEDGQVNSLPSFPTGLIFIDCRGNQIPSLPPLPDSLRTLLCGSNPFSFLPFLPNHLITLDCSDNQLSSLPSLPASLQTLDCRYNQLTLLPSLPFIMYDLHCNHNQLTSLTSLPGYISTLDISDNPNLTCLPQINYIGSLNWVNTAISCLPNSFNGYASPSIANVPICAFSNPDSCPVYWSISGKTFADSNSNCLADSGEPLLKNFKIKLYKGSSLQQQVFSNDLGQYAFTTDTGTFNYKIDTTAFSVNVVCPANNVFTTTVSNLSPQNGNNDFSIECKPGFDVGTNGILRTAGRFRPANYATVNVLAGDVSNHYNLHCATGVSGNVTVIINGTVSYISATAGALTPVVTGNTLVYSIADFGTVNFNSDFRFIVQTDTTAQAGDQVCFDVSVTPIAGDNNTSNNNYTQCFTVSNSFDPNEKEVYPSGIIDTSQHYLTYTIYFQNTGNDTALHIYILDTLDNDIDESSIQLLAYSHEPLVQVIGNVVKFNFPNINLVDSITDEPNSHGYVQYRVRLNYGLLPGTVINNTAHIVFDFNAPIVTNTTFNQVNITVLTPTLSKGEGVICDIYPNPVVSGSEFKIVFDAGDVKGGMLNIYDMSGRKFFEKNVFSSRQSQRISLPLLAAGLYECVINFDGRKLYRKLVVIETGK